MSCAEDFNVYIYYNIQFSWKILELQSIVANLQQPVALERHEAALVAGRL